FTHKGHMAGTIERGSRDSDWAVNGQNPDIAKHWDSLRAGSTGFGYARTSLDLGPIVVDVKQGIGAVRDVIAVVGPILGPLEAGLEGGPPASGRRGVSLALVDRTEHLPPDVKVVPETGRK